MVDKKTIDWNKEITYLTAFPGELVQQNIVRFMESLGVESYSLIHNSNKLFIIINSMNPKAHYYEVHSKGNGIGKVEVFLTKRKPKPGEPDDGAAFIGCTLNELLRKFDQLMCYEYSERKQKRKIEKEQKEFKKLQMKNIMTKELKDDKS